nr:hypothetical protein [uncultured Thiodictyon sp.]
MNGVVGNTSPLTNLAAIGAMGLLERLLGRVHIAEAVQLELAAGGHHWPGRAQVAAASWVECHNVQNRSLVLALSQDLDAGESATIALGLEIGATLVLMDEREGRHRAQRMGLRTMGSSVCYCLQRSAGCYRLSVRAWMPCALRPAFG